MTVGATPKGEARRAVLVAAAADLLVEQGFAAVSHRSTAARSGLALAATTYYFASRDDLLAQAADLVAARHVAHVSALLDRLPDRRVGARAAARRAVDVVLPAGLDDAGLLGGYERYLEAGRTPALRPVVTRWNAEVRRLLGVVLERTGHGADPALVLAVVDGLAVTALAEGHDPRRAAARGVERLLA